MWKLLLVGVTLGAVASQETPPVASPRLQALHCPPCERIHCSTRRALKLQCKGGVTTGVCGCCPVCARVEGETCGGTWDYLGKCDKGLVCVYQESDEPDRERRGICEAGEARIWKKKRGNRSLFLTFTAKIAVNCSYSWTFPSS